MTNIEQKQFQALEGWYMRRKDKFKRLGWKYRGESYICDDETLIVVLLCGRNRHYLQVSTEGNVCFAPVRMRCF